MMIKILIIALAVMATPAMAATEWFVAPNGSDSSGNGTVTKPYKTVMRVLNTSTGVVHAGDTVTLRGGTYNECDVRLRKPLTLRSYPGEIAHIHCNMNTPESVTIEIDTGASGSRLSDLEISGGMYYGVMLQTNWYGDGGSGTGPSNIVLDNLNIHDTGRDGIKVTPKTHNVIIRNSEIWNTGAIYPPGTSLDNRNADGIDMVNVANVTIEDNYIHDISTTGLYFKGGSSDVIVQRNRIVNTGMSGILVGFDTSPDYFDTNLNPHYYESIRGIVRNNYVANTEYAGIGLYAAKDAVIANNTIVNTAHLGHAAIYFGITYQDWVAYAERPPSVNPLIRNNLVIQNGGACVAIRWSGDLGGLSALTGSPNSDWNAYHDTSGSCRFIDRRPGSSLDNGGTLAQWYGAEGSGKHSFETTLSVNASGHLPAGSAAINAGTTVSQVSDDIDKEPRHTPYDIGADEVRSGPLPDGIFSGSFD